MFDIGFLEILVIMVIALLVIGPERMPEVARKIGSFMGKMKRFVNSMKEDSPIQETMNEVKSAMNFEEEKKRVENIGKELEQGLNFDDVNLDMDQFQRPNFGGDETSTQASAGGSQFNRAPSQPQAPKQETSPQPQQAVTDASEPASAPTAPVEPVQSAATANNAEKETQKS